MSSNPNESGQLELPTEHADADSPDAAGEGIDKLLAAVGAGKLDTLQEKIAWLLNNHPEARDSDIKLQLAYWEQFESNIYDGVSVTPSEMFQLTKLTSVARARAKIQNEYKLFQASPEVRQMRGTLSQEEREKAREQRPPMPLFAIYADESGKNSPHLILGSVWFLHGPETLTFVNKIQRWREYAGFEEELHFRTIDDSNIDRYLEIASLVASESDVVSYKALSVERRGIGRVDQALAKLYYHLIVRGVEQESATGRAPLPRRLQLWKDAEEPGSDQLLLADLEDQLMQASESRFDGRLEVDLLRAVDSKENPIVQIADLFAARIGGCFIRSLVLGVVASCLRLDPLHQCGLADPDCPADPQVCRTLAALDDLVEAPALDSSQLGRFTHAE